MTNIVKIEENPYGIKTSESKIFIKISDFSQSEVEKLYQDFKWWNVQAVKQEIVFENYDENISEYIFERFARFSVEQNDDKIVVKNF